MPGILTGPLASYFSRQKTKFHFTKSKQKFQGDFWTCYACYITVQQVEKPYQEVEISGRPRIKFYFYAHEIFCCAKVSNRQSANVIFRFVRLTIIHYNRYNSHMSQYQISATHTLNCIVHRVKYGLTICEEVTNPLQLFMLLSHSQLLIACRTKWNSSEVYLPTS